jgi:hypothetical protein
MGVVIEVYNNLDLCLFLSRRGGSGFDWICLRGSGTMLGGDACRGSGGVLEDRGCRTGKIGRCGVRDGRDAQQSQGIGCRWGTTLMRQRPARQAGRCCLVCRIPKSSTQTESNTAGGVAEKAGGGYLDVVTRTKLDEEAEVAQKS